MPPLYGCLGVSASHFAHGACTRLVGSMWMLHELTTNRRARFVTVARQTAASCYAAPPHCHKDCVCHRRSAQRLCAAGEFDAFLARAARGRNELELARRDETDKRQNRFRTLVQVSFQAAAVPKVD